MSKSIDLELNEVDVLLCITGHILDWNDKEIVGNIVECIIADMKELPSEYRNLDACREDVAVNVRQTLRDILKKLGG